LAAPIPQPKKLWALVTAGGLFVLASIGPTYGAVMGWVERNRRRGLSEMAERGETIRPVTLAFDPARGEEQRRGRDNIRVMRTGS